MKGTLKRTLHISLIMCFIWLLLIALFIFIDRVILNIEIENPIARALFRNGISFLLFSLLLLFWRQITLWYYHKYVKGK
ncbi:MAG: hypothetical protein DRJ66_06690 [Thermoprotei archaeon]|nr:MAG: hypothetical protein DRJ66_06690 [Thermoprotei archaeon]RLF20128.1 MAG: hypothetical protein DRZ82_03305 [Thermoprotei archaeon]